MQTFVKETQMKSYLVGGESEETFKFKIPKPKKTTHWGYES